MQPMKQWHFRSAVLAVAVLAGGMSVSAQALVLGQIRINSALGEPIKAEIPVTKITSDEATSLKINLADANDFTGHGLLYNAAIAAMRVDFKMTSGTTGLINISGMKPVQDPFVDLLLDVRWRTGGMQRSYTMLFDPPEHISDNAVYSSPTPQVSILEDSQGSVATPDTSFPVSVTQSSNEIAVNRERLPDGTIHERIGPSRPTESVEPPLKGDAPGAKSKRTEKLPQSGNVSSSSHVTVGKGQTLGQIASLMKPAGVSQDQMLAALFRANPNAFINHNINLVRAGVNLAIPSEGDIAAISKSEARNLVRSHNRQFNEYRAQLAGGANRVVPNKQKSGTVQVTTGAVDNTPPVVAGNTAVPKLEITPGTVQEQAQDQATAASMQAENMNTHLGDFIKARDEMRDIENQINQTGEGGMQTSLTPDATLGSNTDSNPTNASNVTSVTDHSSPLDEGTLPVESTVPLPTDPLVLGNQAAGNEPSSVDSTSGSQEPVTVTADEGKPQQEAPKTEQPAQPAASNVPATGAVEESLVEIMLKKPWIPLGGLAAIIFMVFAGLKLARRRNKHVISGDTGALESTNDSFFTDSHQSSSMMDQSSSIYAASQLDTNVDVDPLQEADVYLAYGRDEQAAEILRDAIQIDPDRAALHAKLCEIYAKQGNTSRFESQRNQLRVITGGQGADWERVEKVKNEMNAASGNGNSIQDFSEQANPGIASNFAPPAQPVASQSNSFQAPATNVNNDLPSLEITNDTLSSLKSAPQTIDFTNEPVSEMPDEQEGPLTRLALAEEFLAIGNKVDAKEIAQEVLSENLPADLKARAQSLLNKAS